MALLNIAGSSAGSPAAALLLLLLLLFLPLLLPPLLPSSPCCYYCCMSAARTCRPCRSFATLLNNTNISEERRDEVLAGAPVDERNRSTADVYFTVAEVPDSPGTWMYT